MMIWIGLDHCAPHLTTFIRSYVAVVRLQCN